MSPTFQRNNLAGRIHDGRIGANRPPNWIVAIIHVNDDYLGGIGCLLPYTNEFIRFHRECTEGYRIRVDSDICELKKKRKNGNN